MSDFVRHFAPAASTRYVAVLQLTPDAVDGLKGDELKGALRQHLERIRTRHLETSTGASVVFDSNSINVETAQIDTYVTGTARDAVLLFEAMRGVTVQPGSGVPVSVLRQVPLPRNARQYELRAKFEPYVLNSKSAFARHEAKVRTTLAEAITSVREAMPGLQFAADFGKVSLSSHSVPIYCEPAVADEIGRELGFKDFSLEAAPEPASFVKDLTGHYHEL